jgi:hypothetical protein
MGQSGRRCADPTPQRPFLTAAAGREEGSMMGWGRDLNSSFRRTTPRTT